MVPPTPRTVSATGSNRSVRGNAISLARIALLRGNGRRRIPQGDSDRHAIADDVEDRRVSLGHGDKLALLFVREIAIDAEGDADRREAVAHGLAEPEEAPEVEVALEAAGDGLDCHA